MIIKDIINAMKEVRKNDKIVKHYLQFTPEMLLNLEKEEFYNVLFYCIQLSVSPDVFKLYNDIQKTISVVMNTDAEMKNGGLCQFFVNSSREFAPYVEEALKNIGAKEHAKLYRDFIESQGIDVNHLESFICHSIKDYEEKLSLYPFEEFDLQYYTYCDEKDIIDLVIEYARAHVEHIL